MNRRRQKASIFQVMLVFSPGIVVIIILFASLKSQIDNHIQTMFQTLGANSYPCSDMETNNPVVGKTPTLPANFDLITPTNTPTNTPLPTCTPTPSGTRTPSSLDAVRPK